MPQLGMHAWNAACSIVPTSAYKIFTQTLFSHKLVFRIGACFCHVSAGLILTSGCTDNERSETVHCVLKIPTQLVMVNFHGRVGEGAKDSDNGDFPDGHFTHRLQVLIPLLNIHLVLLTGGRDQLKRGERGYSVVYRQ